VHALLDSWARWVDELADHPLDTNEYATLLSTRAQLEIALEIAGSSALWAAVDETDGRFQGITNEPSNDDREQSEWWSRRVPTSAEHRLYLAQDVAAHRLSGEMSVADVASELRRRFSLSPTATIKALRTAGVPLAEGKIAVDATLSADALQATDELRDLAGQAILANVRSEPR
jgi:hypothetical protein